MSARQDSRRATPRHNLLLGWGLGLVAVLLYGAMAWRMTQGF